MGTKRVAAEKRCSKCNLNQMWCICPLINEVENVSSFVSIIMHYREKHLTSNTASLLVKSLKNSDIVLRGLKDLSVSDQFEFKVGYQPLYLFPHDDAAELTQDYLSSFQTDKFQLIIPDGTWSQAQKIKRREGFLKDIPCVKLPEQYKSQYGLRKPRLLLC